MSERGVTEGVPGRRPGRPRAVLVVFALLAAVTAGLACAPGNAAPATPRVEMRDYYFDPADLDLRAGQQVYLTLANHGGERHEMLIGREVETANGVPIGYRHSFFADKRVFFTGEGFDWEYEGDLLELEVMPGGAVTLEFVVPEGMGGEWEMGCLIPGHYEAGMHGRLVVQGES